MHRSAVVVLLALALFASSGQAEAADPALVEAAKKEGKVVWYTTLIVNQAIRPLKAAFEKKYPGIELQFSRADETPTAAKILEEGVAGRDAGRRLRRHHQHDPAQAGAAAGSLCPSRPPGSIRPSSRTVSGHWNALLLYVFTPGINTTLVPKERAPKTYQDLLDPQWKGKMAWNPNSIAGAIGFVGNILTSMGEQRGHGTI